jgi:NAD dependent epimerase/dehydratase family
LRYFVTGCAGFIGSNLTDRLLALGHEVVGFDNLSTGQESFLQNARSFPQFTFCKGDLLDPHRVTRAMDGCEFVFHFAANADVRFGTEHPTKDLHQNTIATVSFLPPVQSTVKPRSSLRRRTRPYRRKLPFMALPSSLLKASFTPTAKASQCRHLFFDSSLFSESDIHTAMSWTFISNCKLIQGSCRFWEMGSSENHTCASRIVSTRS